MWTLTVSIGTVISSARPLEVILRRIVFILGLLGWVVADINTGMEEKVNYYFESNCFSK
jgi:hypothetical protein